MLVGIVPTGITNIGQVIVASPPSGGAKGLPPTILTTTGVTKTRRVCGTNNTRTVTTLTCKARAVTPISGVANPKGVFITLTGHRIFKSISVSVVTNPDRVTVLTSSATRTSRITSSLLSRTRRSPVTDTILIAPSSTLTTRISERISHRLTRLPERRVTFRSVRGCNTICITRGVSMTVRAIGDLTPRRLRVLARGPVRLLKQVHRTKTVFLKEFDPRPINSCFTNPGRILPAGKATHFSDPLGIRSFRGGSDVLLCDRGTLGSGNRGVTTFTHLRNLRTRTESVRAELEGWTKKVVVTEATRVSHGAGRAGVALSLGVSNRNGDSLRAKIPFVARVLSLFTGRKRFSLGVITGNSASISSRRAARSVNVYLNRMLGSTLNSGGNVGHCKGTFIPVSRTLTRIAISLDGHPRLRVHTRFPDRGINAFSARLIRRFL